MLAENLKTVRENITEACRRANRDPSEVTLVAVSKIKPEADIQEIYGQGVRDFGENYVQELVEKIDHLPGDIRWHMIGHLQRNKVKYLARRADSIALIHSVDTYRLAEEINIQAKKNKRIIDILVEVNIADEDSKFGISREDALSLIQDIAGLDGIHIRGLMTSAPNVKNAEENRAYFRSIKALAVDINSRNIDNVEMDILSMGMTNDYQIAIEEGSTMVRVGTAIFGARDYHRKS